MFQIADRQDVEVASHLSVVDGRMVWDVKLRQSMFDWEVDQLVDLLAELYGLRLRWRCKGDKGVFFVSSFYRYSWWPGMFLSLGGGFGFLGFHLKWLLFFVWSAVHSQILTLDNLMYRGHVLANWCCLYCQDAESVPHLLLHCPMTSPLWGLIFGVFNLVWVQQGMVREVLAS